MKKLFIISTCTLFLSLSLFATPLIDAVKKNDANSVRALLKKGVDKNVKDNQGLSALDYAITYKYSEIAQILYSDDYNNYIFLTQKGKPLHVKFSPDGFKFEDSKIDNQIIALGTITPDSFKEICESFKRSRKNALHPIRTKFRLFLVVTQLDSFAKIKEIKGECTKFTTFLYPNYEFYQILAKLFKYQGVPEFLFRDKSGKLTGGSIESNIFESKNGLTRIIK